MKLRILVKETQFLITHYYDEALRMIDSFSKLSICFIYRNTVIPLIMGIGQPYISHPTTQRIANTIYLLLRKKIGIMENTYTLPKSISVNQIPQIWSIQLRWDLLKSKKS